MISPEILSQLVPSSNPEDEWPLDRTRLDFDLDGSSRWIGVWASYLRYRISREMQKDKSIDALIESSGFVGTGIFRVPSSKDARDHEGFPIVNGYQFGAVLLRANRSREGTYISGIPLDFGRYTAPIIQTVATLNPHAPAMRAGYVAAFFKDEDGSDCGITAGHVVDGFRRGQRVPVECSACRVSARLKKKAPGLIDAATIEFRCGGPRYGSMVSSPTVRVAVEGETVEAHFGDTGKMICTVMLSLSSSTQIKCAAAPRHFLTDVYGHPGDSGSLVSGQDVGTGERDLIGMYLGDADCEDENRNYVTYGYSLCLKQAADLFGATDLTGDFNV